MLESVTGYSHSRHMEDAVAPCFSPIKMISLSTDCPFHLEVHHFGGADLTGYGGFNTFVTCGFTKLLKGW